MLPMFVNDDSSCAQGLGLLINLVEYSARNRHCLVEMEVDMSYLNDTTVSVKTENDVQMKGEEETNTEEQKEGEGEKGTTTQKLMFNALVALVQVCFRFLHSINVCSVLT